jgi:chloride channel protein, CIC family
MNPRAEAVSEPPDREGSLLVLAFLALVIGAAAGLIGATFQLALERADRLLHLLLVWGHHRGPVGLLLVIAACAISTAIAARLVHRYSPYSSGSGIAHVEAVIGGDLAQAPFVLIPMKYIGGVLAFGSGLALGPEGPSVQIGASVAHLVGKIFRRSWPDCRVLLAAGAGAGLAAVFNAPIAGAAFVLEELVRHFETRVAIAALAASATAIWVARMLLGNAPAFQIPPLQYADSGTGLLYLLLGFLAGFLGIIYNRTLIGTLAVADRLDKRVELRAAIIGGAVGIIAWFGPGLVGSGESMIQRTLQGETVAMLLSIFCIRLALGAISYAAGTPGGLMAPILALGALSGMFLGCVCKLSFPSLGIQPETFAVVGMAAFLTAVTRAPLTGLVLVIEMTASFTMFLPMLVACFGAMLVPTLLHNSPLYDSLRERVLRTQALGKGQAFARIWSPQQAPRSAREV